MSGQTTTLDRSREYPIIQNADGYVTSQPGSPLGWIPLKILVIPGP